MRALVTGAAGFIGSHLCERLLEDGWDVTGVDAFTDYYPRPVKQRNIEVARQHAEFRLVEADVAEIELGPMLEGVDAVFHLAAQPGVRLSWGSNYAGYLHDNVLASQRLFEAVKLAPSVRKLVYASSSSVYGDAETYPTLETMQLRPISPYGQTKQAVEQLAYLYAKNFGVPLVGVRPFTVYGPRQRPDMFFHLLCRAVLEGSEFSVFGDGEQSREFTFVTDVVDALLQVAEKGRIGEVYNVGGGSQATVNEAIALMEAISGKAAIVHYTGAVDGDARRTAADITKAREELGYAPAVSLRDGLEREYRWLEALLASESKATR
jgi:UDP-glucose 4-epimerase